MFRVVSLRKQDVKYAQSELGSGDVRILLEPLSADVLYEEDIWSLTDSPFRKMQGVAKDLNHCVHFEADGLVSQVPGVFSFGKGFGIRHGGITYIPAQGSGKCAFYHDGFLETVEAVTTKVRLDGVDYPITRVDLAVNFRWPDHVHSYCTSVYLDRKREEIALGKEQQFDHEVHPQPMGMVGELQPWGIDFFPLAPPAMPVISQELLEKLLIAVKSPVKPVWKPEYNDLFIKIMRDVPKTPRNLGEFCRGATLPQQARVELEKAIRNGQLGRNRRELLRLLDRSPKDAARLFLIWHYAVAPLGRDTVKVSRQMRILAGSTPAYTEVMYARGSLSDDGWLGTRNLGVTMKPTASYEINTDAELMARLDELEDKVGEGLRAGSLFNSTHLNKWRSFSEMANDMSIAGLPTDRYQLACFMWELTPLSFAVDWGYDISERFRNLHRQVLWGQLPIDYFVRTIDVARDGSAIIQAILDRSSIACHASLSWFYYRRAYETEVPTLPIDPVGPDPYGSHWVEGAAVVIGGIPTIGAVLNRTGVTRALRRSISRRNAVRAIRRRRLARDAARHARREARFAERESRRLRNRMYRHSWRAINDPSTRLAAHESFNRDVEIYAAVFGRKEAEISARVAQARALQRYSTRTWWSANPAVIAREERAYLRQQGRAEDYFYRLSELNERYSQIARRGFPPRQVDAYNRDIINLMGLNANVIGPILTNWGNRVPRVIRKKP